MGVGRPADNLDLPLARIDHTDPEPVGIGMALGRNDRRDREGFETGGTVLDAFHFVAEHREPLGYHGGRRVGFKMLFQPGEGCLHAAPPGNGPRTREGMSSGRNP